MIYPVDDAILNDLAYHFEYCYDDGRDPKSYVAAIKKSIDSWRKDYEDGSNLSHRRGPGFLLIDDRRPGLGGYDYTLKETEAKIYLACDRGATAMAAWQAVQAEGSTDIELEDVVDFLDEMTDLRLLYEEAGVYLSLAVPHALAGNERVDVQQSSCVEWKPIGAST